MPFYSDFPIYISFTFWNIKKKALLRVKIIKKPAFGTQRDK